MSRLCPFLEILNGQVLRMGGIPLPEQSIRMPVKKGTIHHWSIPYSTLDRHYPYLSALVSPVEMRKADGFKKPDDARRYILRHGMVRAVVGHYIHEDPEKVRFVQGINGKPDIDSFGIFPEIRFSLSRTNEMVCLGVTWESAIGLDIVKTRSRYSFSAMAQYLFTPCENRWIAQAAPDRRPIRFFRIWALKEALLKATGSDVRIMKEADVSSIMTDTFLDSSFTVDLGETDQKCFIHESVCGMGHHCAIATIPGTAREKNI